MSASLQNSSVAHAHNAVHASHLSSSAASSTVATVASPEGVLPQTAWNLFSTGQAVLVDVRTAEERTFVGYVPDSVHIPWATGTSMTRNPRFVRELESKVGKHKTILLLCRSGKRSALAAEAATKGGFTTVFNVLEGFEGELNDQQQRGTADGWRYRNLPWVQS